MATKYHKKNKDQDQEIWKDIPNHPYCQVSNIGRFRYKWMFCRKGTKRNDRWIRLDYWRIINQSDNGRGYYKVSLKGVWRVSHQVVLEVFVGPRENGMVSRRLNGNKLDNRLVNLKWGTQWENIQDNVRLGTVLKGENNPAAKLTEKDVLEIKEARKRKVLLRVLSEKYGVSKANISFIASGKFWRHVK